MSFEVTRKKERSFRVYGYKEGSHFDGRGAFLISGA